MAATRVLVAFASQSGSTAAIAEVITAELRAAGLETTCAAASDVPTLRGYDALVLGSGVFVRRRATDGGGFLAHHATCVRATPVWLFCSGPIGRGRDADGQPAAECPVFDVARRVGARGAAAFGTLSMDREADEFDRPVDMRRVRAWAQEIATALGRPTLAAAS